MAEALGMGRATIARYISGETPVPTVVILALQTLRQGVESEAVYEVSSPLTNRKYYGVSAYPWARWREHLVASRKGDLPLYEDMRALGANNFSMRILSFFEDRPAALAEESRLIVAALNAGQNPYNFAPGSAWLNRDEEDNLREELSDLITRTGGMRALCREHSLNVSSVSRFLSGHRRPSTEIMMLLGKIPAV
jgi:transcriptional regulator with XRE-family HTH domain